MLVSVTINYMELPCNSNFLIPIPGRPLHKGFLGGAKANSAFRIDKPLKPVKPARLLKPLSASKLLKTPAAKLTKKPSHSDVANTIDLPKEDEFRNLECKNELFSNFPV